MLGHYAFFVGLRFKTTQDLIDRLDSDNYTEAETFTLKVPLAVPYNDDAKDYKRANGEIEYKGEYYRLVKQKLCNDTLYMVCLKDQNSKKLKQVLKDYVNTFTDKPVNTSRQTSELPPGFSKDYLALHITLVSDAAGWHSLLCYSPLVMLTSDIYLSVLSPPPKA